MDMGRKSELQAATEPAGVPAAICVKEGAAQDIPRTSFLPQAASTQAVPG